MTDAAEYRRRAETCRTAACLGRRRPSPYLLDLAEHYDSEAAALEKQFAGDKPKPSAPRKPTIKERE